MFDGLTERLTQSLNRLRGSGRLTEENVKETLREVRMALLEADVALPVVREFIDHVRERAVGQEVLKSLTPGQALVKIVHDELVALMGEAEGLQLNARPPVVILMAGLQGSGKTTTVGKLARFLKERHKKSVLVTSADVYRPAAIDQLATLAREVGVEFQPSDPSQDPVSIARRAVDEARNRYLDVVIIDTAGRLHIDQEMMDEIRRVHEAIEPTETLFVVDSMTGQDAANTARAFGEALPLTGVVLTKADGDARGGAALSVRHITGRPIKFLGMGEKSSALEPFFPDRIASRILGMGDVLTLVEEVQRRVDREQAEKLAKKVTKGKGFDLQDFRDQLSQFQGMGGISAFADKLPGMGQIGDDKMVQGDKEMRRISAIIDSMTPTERRKPEIINGSRRRRIAAGSGTQVQDVNRVLKQFKDMQTMMKKFSTKGGVAKLMRSLKGRLPPGIGF